MFPYTKYLQSLFVIHNTRFDVVSGKLRGVGIFLSEDALKGFYYQYFLFKLPEHLQSSFRHNITLHALNPRVFHEVVFHFKISKFFNERRLFDYERFDGILKNRLIHRHIECSLIGRLTPAEITNDINETYSVSVHPHLIDDFRELFIDLTQVRHQSDWTLYMKTLPRDEQIFRNAVILQPKDYVRWKLGVRVKVDSSEALQDIAADMFWRYKESLSENCIETSRRIADTAMKAMSQLSRMSKADASKVKQRNFNSLLLTFGDDDNTKTIHDIEIDSVPAS